ncbi:MAG: polysaccharide biosynthesis protein [Limnochordaceae bacterium]|nr:polysaccharide biosynthesis protein [Limnochordaceae bacterium]
MEARHFARGALALTIAGLFSRFLGIFYLIPLPRLIGDQGMGLLQMGAAWQGLLLVLASGGLPMALARGVAEQRAAGQSGAAERLLLAALAINFVLGLAGTLVLWHIAPSLAWRIEGDSGATMVLRVYAPSVVILALASSIRGYYQGRQEMGLVAASEVVEQLFRVGAMLGVGWWLTAEGITRAAAGAASGAMVGGLATLTLLVIGFAVSPEKRETIGRALSRSAGWITRRPSTWALVKSHLVPVAPAGAALALTYAAVQAAEASVIPRALRHTGLSVVAVREQYGQYALAFRLIHLPAVVSISLASTLLPAVAYAQAAGKLSLAARRVGQTVRFVLLVSLPAAAGLAVLARPITGLLFGYPEVAMPLRAATPAVVGLMLFQASTGALQGLGRPYLPAISLGWGGLVQLVAAWYGITRGGGVAAAAAAAALGWGVAAAFNLMVLLRQLGGGSMIAWHDVIRPLLAAAGMAWGVATFHPWLQRALVDDAGWGGNQGVAVGTSLLSLAAAAGSLTGAVVAGAVLYFALLASLGGISREEGAFLRRWLLPWRTGTR